MDKHKQGGDEAATSSATEQPIQRSKGVGPWLFVAGAMLIATGAGLTALPTVAHDLAWITNSLSRHGIEGAPIALTGLVLCGMWTIGRARREVPAPTTGVDHDLLLEQIASDMALARGGMQDLRVEFVYLKDQVQSAATQRELQEAQSAGNDAQSAMYGLAASMDQLTARLEQRLKNQDLALQESISSLRREIGETGAGVASLRARIEEGLQTANDQHDVDVAYHATDERQVEIESGYHADADDLEVYVELEEPQSQGLGLLDEIDDLGQHHSAKQSLSIRPASTRAQIALDMDRTAGPIPARNGHGEFGVDEKLATLRALMSDPSVRQALEAARRSS